MNNDNTQPPPAPNTFKHREAFCLMRYASQDGKTVEWIWNSRDGVTPFCLCEQKPQLEKDAPEYPVVILQHVEWHHDVRIPEYTPYPGERIFVDDLDQPGQPQMILAEDLEAYVARAADRNPAEAPVYLRALLVRTRGLAIERENHRLNMLPPANV